MLRPVTITFAPIFEQLTAIDLPIPAEEPVIKTILFSKLKGL
jgi:hypothetical protein